MWGHRQVLFRESVFKWLIYVFLVVVFASLGGIGRFELFIVEQIPFKIVKKRVEFQLNYSINEPKSILG